LLLSFFVGRERRPVTRRSEHPGKHPSSPRGVLVVLQRSGCVSEAPASTAREVGGLQREVQARASQHASGTSQEHPSARPDGVLANLPARGMVAAPDCAREAPRGSWADGIGLVLEQFGIQVLGTEHSPALGYARSARSPPPSRTPDCGVAASHVPAWAVPSASSHFAFLVPKSTLINQQFQPRPGDSFRRFLSDSCRSHTAHPVAAVDRQRHI